MNPSPPGRLLGVDYGTVRVGLAISDPDRRIASPLETHQRRSPSADAAFWRALCQREAVVGLVVGLPVHNDGSEGAKAREARAYAQWLTETTGLSVVFWDERFSTIQAESALWGAGLTHKRRKERRDRVAAALVLQAYLDAGCPIAPEEPGPLQEDVAE